MVVTSTGFRAQETEFEFWLCYQLAKFPQVSYLTSWCFCSLIWKTGLKSINTILIRLLWWSKNLLSVQNLGLYWYIASTLSKLASSSNNSSISGIIVYFYTLPPRDYNWKIFQIIFSLFNLLFSLENLLGK